MQPLAMKRERFKFKISNCAGNSVFRITITQVNQNICFPATDRADVS